MAPFLPHAPISATFRGVRRLAACTDSLRVQRHPPSMQHASSLWIICPTGHRSVVCHVSPGAPVCRGLVLRRDVPEEILLWGFVPEC